MLHAKLAATAAALALIGGGAAAASLSAGAAVAPPSTVTGVTHITDRPDSGNGGIWAYDTFDRTLTVTADPANNTAEQLAYTATISDSGTYDAITGVHAPNQSTPGTLITHGVSGPMSGTWSYEILAPNTDTLTGVIPVAEDDQFGANPNLVHSSDWPALAFASPEGVVVTPKDDWSWTYSTACEQWTDAADNGDGNIAVDGNITGRTCPVTPYVYGGQWLTRSASRATVSWSYSDGGWPNNAKCVEVYITGYGFAPIGDFAHAHIGFTCGTTGYLAGLKPNHTYALRIVPAAGTYTSHTPITGAPSGYVDVFTLADATELGLPLS